MKTQIQAKLANTIKQGAYLTASLILSLMALGGTKVYAAGTAAFTIEASATTINVGGSSELNLYVTPAGANLLTATLRLNFPASLQYQSFNSGGTPFSISTTTGAPAVGASNVQIITSYFPPTTGAAGSKLYIGKVAVNGISAGTGQVTMSDVGASELSGADMPATAENQSITVNSISQPPVDTDGDGIIDSSDACPTVAEDKDGKDDGDGCPEEDVPTAPTTTKKTTTKPAGSKVTVPNKTEPTKSEVVAVEEIINASPITASTPKSAAKTSKSAANASAIKIAVASMAGLSLLAAGVVILRRRSMWGSRVEGWGNKFNPVNYYKNPSDKFTQTPPSTPTPSKPTPTVAGPEINLLDKVKGPEVTPPGQVVTPKKPDDTDTSL